MNTSKSIDNRCFSDISLNELSEIKAGAVPLAAAALAVAAVKVLIDATYCIGYAVGYIKGSLD